MCNQNGRRYSGVMEKIRKIVSRDDRCNCMLQNLHVKNIALIDETEVDFGQGLEYTDW